MGEGAAGLFSILHRRALFKNMKKKQKIRLKWMSTMHFTGRIFAADPQRPWTWEEIKAGCGLIGKTR
jgi:hypothetical protein